MKPTHIKQRLPNAAFSAASSRGIRDVMIIRKSNESRYVRSKEITPVATQFRIEYSRVLLRYQMQIQPDSTVIR